MAENAAHKLLVFLCGGVLSVLVTNILFRYFQRLLARRIFTKTHQCHTLGPSYPHIPFLFGLDFMYENAVNILNFRFAEKVRRRFASYGTTHTAQILHRRMVNTIDPENLQAVMNTNFDHYTIIPGREKLMCVLFGRGVFSTHGAEWRHSRSLIRKSMTDLRLDPVIFERNSTLMIEKIRALGGHQVTDFGKLAFEWTLAVATSTIIGETTQVTVGQHDNHSNTATAETDYHQFGRDFTRLGQMARVLTIMISQIPYLTNLWYWNEYKPTQRRVFRKVLRIRYSGNGRRDWRLIRKPSTLLEGVASQSRDIERIRGETLHLLLAGHDTVGIALSEMFWCLSRHPLVWEKLRVEVEDAFHGTIPSFSGLKKLTYLHNVINEAIRIRPTLSVHGRRAVQDTVLPHGGGPEGRGPLFVERGTYIVYSNYALYRNPAVFGPDVDSFRPERWAEGVNPARYEFLNFGAGPRHCPGKEMGWTMLAYLTVRLAQTVKELRPYDNRPWQEARAFSFHNKHGVHIAMTLE